MVCLIFTSKFAFNLKFKILLNYIHFFEIYTIKKVITANLSERLEKDFELRLFFYNAIMKRKFIKQINGRKIIFQQHC
jgi:hypothetical protein